MKERRIHRHCCWTVCDYELVILAWRPNERLWLLIWVYVGVAFDNDWFLCWVLGVIMLVLDWIGIGPLFMVGPNHFWGRYLPVRYEV